MDAPDPLSNSKVIIQCTDPSGLYETLEPRLSARNPLRNLHWKSASRPLRSITTLNVSFLREETPVGTNSNVRRHQIPGLRETPYVKVYLLRCDDKETYKEKARKEVRQWVKAQTVTGEGKSSSKSQEGHDAFEWLVIHVVLPNTPAASQPKSSKHISLEATESTDSVNSKSKWSGKSSSTLFDKLRADFGSSKSSINRVAQVRLLEPGDRSTALTPSELEEQWRDLLESLKACILRSFDSRVAQYESDIRERDGQSDLPGWNFCTFFVLKEGLAKGFESLGLLDDALAVYDELSLRLDVVVQEQAQKEDQDDSGALLNFSKDSKRLLRDALDPDLESSSSSEETPTVNLNRILSADRDQFPFDVDRKNYRNLILTNDVSALDLRVYLFTKEIEILTRQARGHVTESAGSAKATPDLTILADLVERATQFINLAARSLRLEIYHAWGGQEGLNEAELQTQRTVAGNIVSTWIWCAVMQILGQILPMSGLDMQYGARSLSLDALELFPEPESTLHQTLEVRGKAQRMSLMAETRPSSNDPSQERNKRGPLMPDGAVLPHAVLARPGAERLLVWISKLAIMARGVCESLQATRPWTSEIKQAALQLTRDATSATGTNGHHWESEEGPVTLAASDRDLLAGLNSTTLRAAATSKACFTDLYALLSVFAYRVAAAAKSRTTTQKILTDLVEMEYTQGNYTIAARYLQSIFGPLPRWSYHPSEGYLLNIYADCLRHLERPNEHVRCLVSCLHYSYQGGFAAFSQFSPVKTKIFIEQLFQASTKISPTTLPAGALFKISRIPSTITPLESRDGFAVSIQLSCLADTPTPPIDQIKMRLVSKDGSEPRLITLKTADKIAVDVNGTNILLETTVTASGWYSIDDVEICIGNLRLLHLFGSTQEAELSRFDDGPHLPLTDVPILVYPSSRSFGIKMYPSPLIHLAEIRRLLLQIRPGLNEVKQCKLRLKTATAGLRLNIHDSKPVGSRAEGSSLRTAREGDALIMILDNLAPESVTEIEIPYTMEIVSEPAVTIRTEVSYETDQGAFSSYDTMVIKVILPVTVNVQDIFRKSSMYSRFTISPSTMVPLRVIGCNLEGDGSYDVVTGADFDAPIVAYPKQPAHWTVQLLPKAEDTMKSSQRMVLSVNFQSLDGIILAILENHFTQEILKTRHAFSARLLTSHLLNRVQTTWTEQDVEVASLLQEFEIWKMGDLEWPTVLCAFESNTRYEIEEWLRDWHKRTQSIKFSSSDVPLRQLKLFVDVPPRPVLVAAWLDLGLPRRTQYRATLGQPIVADLTIQLEDSGEMDLEAAFELVAPPDSWVIGGRRKGMARLSPEPLRMPVVLFPQQLGHLLLPAITTRCRRREKSGGKDEWADVTSDLHTPMHGRSILITPDLKSTTLEIFGEPDDGAGRLVSSESRAMA